MGAAVLAAVGLGLGIGGTAMKASGAKRRRNELSSATDKWLPDIPLYEQQYFDAVRKRLPESTKLADEISQTDFDRMMRLREQAMPGFQKGLVGASEALFPLLRGELPPSILDAYTRAGAANSVGTGFGGSGFGFLNTGLFGARGALGAMQTGYGLLPALMGAMPQINPMSSSAFLNQIMSPLQRTQTQLQVRGQNIGIAGQVAQMPMSKEVWGDFMQQTGGQLAGVGMMGMGSGGGGGGGMFGGFSSSGINAGGFSGGGAAGGWSGGSNWASGMA